MGSTRLANGHCRGRGEGSQWTSVGWVASIDSAAVMQIGTGDERMLNVGVKSVFSWRL
jgi:hypothetical protein